MRPKHSWTRKTPVMKQLLEVLWSRDWALGIPPLDQLSKSFTIRNWYEAILATLLRLMCRRRLITTWPPNQLHTLLRHLDLVNYKLISTPLKALINRLVLLPSRRHSLRRIRPRKQPMTTLLPSLLELPMLPTCQQTPAQILNCKAGWTHGRQIAAPIMAHRLPKLISW